MCARKLRCFTQYYVYHESTFCKPHIFVLVCSSGGFRHEQTPERVGSEEEEHGETEVTGAGEAERGAKTTGEGRGGAT